VSIERKKLMNDGWLDFVISPETLNISRYCQLARWKTYRWTLLFWRMNYKTSLILQLFKLRNFMTLSAQGQPALRNITTNPSCLLWLIQIIKSNWFQELHEPQFKSWLAEERIVKRQYSLHRRCSFLLFLYTLPTHLTGAKDRGQSSRRETSVKSNVHATSRVIRRSSHKFGFGHSKTILRVNPAWIGIWTKILCFLGIKPPY